MKGLICCCLFLFPGILIAEADAVLKEALKPGHVIILRHALAPGTGDPATFKLGDCSTQRNLSRKGRDQAKRMGERLRAQGVKDAAVFTSQWCRCVDTADAMAVGQVAELPALNSFFGRPAQREPQMKALRAWLKDQRPQEGPVILVTHQVVITALTDVFPASGEMVVIREKDGDWEVVGRVR